MPGLVYGQEAEHVQVGAVVYVRCDDGVVPFGLWRARVTEVHSVPTRGKTGEAVAVIDDPRVATQCYAPEFLGKEPRNGRHVRYLILGAPSAIEWSLNMYERAQGKADELERRIETERSAYQSLFKALVSGDALEKLEALLMRFVDKFTR